MSKLFKIIVVAAISIVVGLLCILGYNNYRKQTATAIPAGKKVSIVLLGCPGAGKGTQAKHLAKYYNIPIIATGDMLRNIAKSGTKLGLKVKQVMESGALVSDEIILDLVKKRLEQNDCKRGYLLDGFPRTVTQAEAIRKLGIAIDYVVEISVPDTIIVERLSDRRIHPGSGRTYHLKYSPPKVSGIDDITGEALVQRNDDKEETIRKRLKVYYMQTEPLIRYYKSAKNNEASQYIQVDGMKKMEDIQKQIISFIGVVE
jgi:adenylate kinase